MVEDAIVALPMVPAAEYFTKRSGPGRAEGVLVTLYSSWQGPLREIPNTTFDEVLATHGELTRPTDIQRHSGTGTYNGNRFCVLKPTDKGIPDKISVYGPKKKVFTITLGYKGIKRFCSRCQETHVGPCPELKEFYAARDKRKETQIKTKIVSDSTLRHADETGLSADIVCMSGGRLGHVTHVLHNDPKMPDVDQVIVVAGQNDLLRDDETLVQFQETITNSLSFLQNSAYNKYDLTIVKPLLPTDSSQLSTDKAAFYENLCLDKLGDTTFPLKYVTRTTEVEMDGIHPTVPGTELLLKEVNQMTKIITDGRFVTDKKMYRGVNSAFRYGCLFCPKYRDLDGADLYSGCRPPPLPAEGGKADGTPGPGGSADSGTEGPPPTPDNPPADVDMSKTSQKREGDDAPDTPNPSKKLIVPKKTKNKNKNK